MMEVMTYTTEPAEPRRAKVRQFRLRVASGPQAGSEVMSTGARLVIGTHESVQLRCDDKAMSRFHCEIAIENGRALIRDLGSLNGTVVDGLSVFGAYLGERALLTLGKTQIIFE